MARRIAPHAPEHDVRSHVVSTSPRAITTSHLKVDQHAQAVQRGDPAPHAGGPYLPEPGQLSASGPGALCAETHEGWLEDHRYLNMEYLKEQKKELVRTAA